MSKPVRSVKNQYPGINAHLHSFWQAEHRWNRFHNPYITHLMQDLKAQLRRKGYTAEIEDSLQIRRIGDDLPRRPKADLLVYDKDPHRSQLSYSVQNIAELTVAEWIEEEDADHPYSAIAIYSSDLQRGDPVAWIELLSPTNKGNSPDAHDYIGKRRFLLGNGLVFVELDFLHETPPTVIRVIDYSTPQRQHPDAHPYRIAVLDPRPSIRTGPGKVQQFDVDQPIPTMIIPLNGNDKIEFNFNQPYQSLFEQGFYGDEVDYTQRPVHFDYYSPADQARILNRMLAVIKVDRAGLNLEDAPLPLESLPLEEAEAALRQYL